MAGPDATAVAHLILKAPQRSSPGNLESGAPPTSVSPADGLHDEPESSDNITAVHLDAGDAAKASKVPVKFLDDGDASSIQSSHASGRRSAATSDSPRSSHAKGSQAVAHANGHAMMPKDNGGVLPSLWVGSIPNGMKEYDLAQLFRFEPTACKIICGPGRSIGYAIVSFPNAEQTNAVLADNNTITVANRLLPIRVSTKPIRPDRRGARRNPNGN
ncbi:hypothetical protein WJX73_000844 [Symbiochloris irregularis]|uniref:RRM domain-containing protein n=1 Tax=Symbiochloris irregularis TaxID=706552 RepID=A0AAW1P9D1_9CHLO